MTYRGGFGLGLFGAVVFVFACSGRSSDRNEACERTSDCAGNLVCVGGRCGPVNLGISPSDKQCFAVQCSTADDCCATPPCTNFTCTSDKCVSTQTCTGDFNCNFPTPRCNNGTCVRCVQDTDCGGNQTCTNNQCETRCTSDSECPVFFACQNSACVDVGCSSDRECILFENSEFGFCDTSKSPPVCSTKCENDAECGKFELCVSGSCVPAGCETDDECKVILGPLPLGEHAVCRAP